MGAEINPGLIASLTGPTRSGESVLEGSFTRISKRYGNVTTNGGITIPGKITHGSDVSFRNPGKSVGTVTPNMGQAKRARDESINMYFGQIIEHAPTATLFLNPKEERTGLTISRR